MARAPQQHVVLSLNTFGTHDVWDADSSQWYEAAGTPLAGDANNAVLHAALQAAGRSGQRPGIILLQEYRWASGNGIECKDGLLQMLEDAVPGSSWAYARHWQDAPQQRDAVVLWDAALYDGTPAPHTGERFNEYAGRFTSVLLSPRDNPGARFLVSSYHGRFARRDNAGPLAPRLRLDLARGFVELALEEAARALAGDGRAGMPAILGGDWNVDAHLLYDHLARRTPGALVLAPPPPGPDSVRRVLGAENERGELDYFVTLDAGQQQGIVASCTAVYRLAHEQAHLDLGLFDHDPVLVTFQLAARAAPAEPKKGVFATIRKAVGIRSKKALARVSNSSGQTALSIALLDEEAAQAAPAPAAPATPEPPEHRISVHPQQSEGVQPALLQEARGLLEEFLFSACGPPAWWPPGVAWSATWYEEPSNVELVLQHAKSAAEAGTLLGEDMEHDGYLHSVAQHDDGLRPVQEEWLEPEWADAAEADGMTMLQRQLEPASLPDAGWSAAEEEEPEGQAAAEPPLQPGWLWRAGAGAAAGLARRLQGWGAYAIGSEEQEQADPYEWQQEQQQPAAARTVCGECGRRGHDISVCPFARSPEVLEEEELEESQERYHKPPAPQQAARAPQKCSVCRMPGHNAATCHRRTDEEKRELAARYEVPPPPTPQRAAPPPPAPQRAAPAPQQAARAPQKCSVCRMPGHNAATCHRRTDEEKRELAARYEVPPPPTPQRAAPPPPAPQRAAPAPQQAARAPQKCSVCRMPGHNAATCHRRTDEEKRELAARYEVPPPPTPQRAAPPPPAPQRAAPAPQQAARAPQKCSVCRMPGHNAATCHRRTDEEKRELAARYEAPPMPRPQRAAPPTSAQQWAAPPPTTPQRAAPPPPAPQRAAPPPPAPQRAAPPPPAPQRAAPAPQQAARAPQKCSVCRMPGHNAATCHRRTDEEKRELAARYEAPPMPRPQRAAPPTSAQQWAAPPPPTPQRAAPPPPAPQRAAPPPPAPQRAAPAPQQAARAPQKCSVCRMPGHNAATCHRRTDEEKRELARKYY